MIEEENQNTYENGQISLDHCPRRHKPGYKLVGRKIGSQLTHRRIEKKGKDLNWHPEAVFTTSILVEMNGGNEKEREGERWK